jgi:hypothetical protein
VPAALMDRLRERRTQAREAADQILTRAAEDGRDLSPEELVEHAQRVTEEREAADELDRLRDEQIAELRATAAAGRGPVLSRASAELARQFRSAIYAKNPQPIEVYSDCPTSGPTTCPRCRAASAASRSTPATR